MAQPTIENIQILGLHNRQSISVNLRPGLNIVHAHNGVGKTTLLHVLANIAERDLERFCHIRFDRIAATTSNGTCIELRQTHGPHTTVQLLIDNQELDVATKDQPSPTPPNDVAEQSPPQRALTEAIGGRPVYLPAFRSILEATTRRRRPPRYDPWLERGSARREETYERLYSREIMDARTGPRSKERAKDSAHLVATKTLFCRDWFGEFVPIIRFPSLSEVSEELERELADASYKVAVTDVEISGHVFAQVLQAVLREAPSKPSDPNATERLFHQIREYLATLPDHYKTLTDTLSKIPEPHSLTDRKTIANVLTVYEAALEKRVKDGKAAYQRIETFLESVNRFLEAPKRLVTVKQKLPDRSHSREVVAVHMGDNSTELHVLSSGERQVLTLLFSATHMSSGDGMLLIDEPELSLHLWWQRRLLHELMAQAGERQVVVCTHAPELATDHQEAIRDLSRVSWAPASASSEDATSSHVAMDSSEDEEES